MHIPATPDYARTMDSSPRPLTNTSSTTGIPKGSTATLQTDQGSPVPPVDTPAPPSPETIERMRHAIERKVKQAAQSSGK